MEISKRKRFRVACIQNHAGPDWQKNLASLRHQFQRACRRRPHLIACAENCLWRGPNKDMAFVAHHMPAAICQFQRLARTFGVFILLGSTLEASPFKKKYYNTSVLISPKGQILARYRKIHLFDVKLPALKVQESRHIACGKQVVVAKLGPLKAGLTICYDLRFPELFRQLSFLGAQVIFVPSNFTYPTGKAHWEILLRARAIENQVFMIAPAQAGTSATGIRSFGTSMMVDPWGRILAKAGSQGPAILWADLDLKSQVELRRRFPVLRHRKLASILP